MTTLVLIKEAILSLKDRTGSSIPAITKWIASEKKVRQNHESVFILESMSTISDKNFPTVNKTDLTSILCGLLQNISASSRLKYAFNCKM
jgi:hypothetical protein